jgi:hypothetical protein
MEEHQKPEKKPVIFPYKGLPEAIKDGFKKIGGADQAFRFLRKGYKEISWRKRSEESARIRDREADEAWAASTKSGK